MATRRRERGAVLVEMAFLVPVLMLITMGIFEMGLAWSDEVTVTQATRQAARVASHLGNDDDPTPVLIDRETILTLRASMAKQWEDVEFVVIYRADSDGEMDPDCMTASKANKCNFYGIGAPFSNNALTHLDDAGHSVWTMADGNTLWDWDSASRDNQLGSSAHIGVYVQIQHDWQTGFFPGDGLSVSEATVMRLEPEPG